MSPGSKVDISSGPDGSTYTSGHRASATPVNKSSRFHENMENSLMSNLPNMTRTSSSATQGDVVNFLRCVRIDPNSIVVEHKLNKPAECTRLLSAAIGIPNNEFLPGSTKKIQLSSQSPEDLRRLKSAVRESCTKARERVKVFDDCLSAMNRCFPASPSRKRSRLNALSSDRNALLSIDQSAFEVENGKMGSETHATLSGFVPEQQKCGSRTKNSNSNKRTRTSLTDIRINNPARSSEDVDNESDKMRLSNGVSSQVEDKALLVGGGWENPKMKKRRTSMKLDVAAGSGMTKSSDGQRESKQGTHARFLSNACSKLTNSHCFSGFNTVNGGLGVGKTEAMLQTSSGMLSSMSRDDCGNDSHLHETGQRQNFQDKGAANLKTVNKVSSREAFSSSCPAPVSKFNPNRRAPRSGSSGAVSKFSQVSQQSASPKELELSSGTNKVPGSLVANGRKLTASTKSSSPVRNRVQRPQKVPQMTKRTNLSPPIAPVNGTNPVDDATSKMVVNQRGHSSQQVKIKGGNFSPVALSECEESGTVDVNLRVKKKKCDKMDGKSSQDAEKMSPKPGPQRKDKTIDENGNGVGFRKRGRTRRVVASSSSVLPSLEEKPGNVETNKPTRSTRLGLDKNGREGRPPPRKVSDRRVPTRQKLSTVNTAADFLAEACPSSFWKEMEPLFRSMSDVDVSYLKDQANDGKGIDIPTPLPVNASSCLLTPNGLRKEEIKTRRVDLSPEHLPTADKATQSHVSLFERLMSALIPEEDNQMLMEKDVEADGAFCDDLSGYPTSNGNGVKFNGTPLERNGGSFSETRSPGYDNLQNGSLTDQIMSGTICSDQEYCNMSTNDRLVMELQILGIYPDSATDSAQIGNGEEVSEDINNLAEKYHKEVSMKKNFVGKLIDPVSAANELQEKELKENELDKFVLMIYEKYMTYWGPNAHGTKNASGKMAKQAALAFVKRSLKHYQEFVATGKRCFDSTFYRDMFLSEALSFEQSLPSTTVPAGIRKAPTSKIPDGETPVSGPKKGNSSVRGKQKELSLDDVGGGVPSALGGYLPKGKRSGRDRDGKGNNNGVPSRTTTTKSRAASISIKGGKKSKSKTKQKTATNTSPSVDDSLGTPASENDNNKTMLEDPIDLSGLQLPDMIGVNDDLGDEGDFGSWLMNIEDDGVHDSDKGLEIPTDDLADVKFC